MSKSQDLPTEWVDCGETFGDLTPLFGKKMIGPGYEIVVDGEHLLIGHINILGGLCNDCPGIRREDIVERYRQVWQQPS